MKHDPRKSAAVNSLTAVFTSSVHVLGEVEFSAKCIENEKDAYRCRRHGIARQRHMPRLESLVLVAKTRSAIQYSQLRLRPNAHAFPATALVLSTVCGLPRPPLRFVLSTRFFPITSSLIPTRLTISWSPYNRPPRQLIKARTSAASSGFGNPVSHLVSRTAFLHFHFPPLLRLVTNLAILG